MNIYNYLVTLALKPLSLKNERDMSSLDSLGTSSKIKDMLSQQGYEEIHGDKLACETRAPDL